MTLPVFSGAVDGALYTVLHLGPHPSAAGDHLYRVLEHAGSQCVAVATVHDPGGPGELQLAGYRDLVRAALVQPVAGP